MYLKTWCATEKLSKMTSGGDETVRKLIYGDDFVKQLTSLDPTLEGVGCLICKICLSDAVF